ncbi:hypothetical protein [Streptomyces pseudovenezuelae]|uniref:Uncharacterized protein n=1 Tax=Streptomyces pseudovenezuelae TaxID=67350 RepID=A0ABT6LCT4_9ACTN|nr:hypothetical protein [Streptomyces pseudovenezuelae]MDH6213179.1 hypothetical protein [Streptomyces pseudovenezuelae]
MTTALAELGERLQREHGTLWLHRLKGDPYAALLCDVDEDPGPLRELVRAAGPLWRSAAGSWVTADPATAAALLAHPAIEHVPTLPGEAPVTAVDVPDLEPLCARVLDAAGPEFDLVTEVAEPLAAGALAVVCGIPAAEHGRFTEAVTACGIAQDAVVCPQRLDATRQMRGSLDSLRSLPDTVPGPATVVTAARTGADLVARTVLRARLPVRADEIGPTVEAALRAEPPTWIAPLEARADLELAGARIATGERLAVLLQGGPGPAEVPAHRVLAPLYRALAESLLTALADRCTDVRPTAPLVRRPRAPLTRGPARAPMAAGTTSGGAR